MERLLNKVKKAVKNVQSRNQSNKTAISGIEKVFPADFSKKEIEAIEKISGFTMTSDERLVSLYRAVEYIEENKIEGDIVECGVWRGGSTMLIAHVLKKYNSQQRNLFLFDTYEGMTEPSESDISHDKQMAGVLLNSIEKDHEDGNNIWCYASIEDVKSNLYSTGYDSSKLHFIKGKVEETIPTDKINKIALLRLDTDWYESTKHELDHLYDKLVKGGILIIDDYGHWQGAKKAVDEFIQNRKIKLFLNRMDYTGRLAIKID